MYRAPNGNTWTFPPLGGNPVHIPGVVLQHGSRGAAFVGTQCALRVRVNAAFGPRTVAHESGDRPLGGVQAGPGPPGTPAILILPEPLGARTLLDGGRTPVGPPSPGFIPASPGT